MSRLSVLAISDIHFGCPRIDPYRLENKLKKYLFPHIPDNKILFICGDFFDNVITLNSRAAFVAVHLIHELREVCRQTGCDLRVLRGTYTHDRDQPKHFVNGVDPSEDYVKVFDTISLEHHEKTGLNILYIPDNHGSKDIYEDIRKVLDAHNLKAADILIHHGYFKHMLPTALLEKGLPHGCLEEEKISKYVKGCVLNGHVHISSVYKNIISIGSFDRLAHGEEESKGLYQINIDDGIYKFNFIENMDATKFITYNLLSFENAEQALSYFDSKYSELVPKLKEDEPIRIRILSDDKAVVEGCTQIAKQRYKNVLVDHGSVVKREALIENIPTDLSELPVITDDNLPELLMPILKKHGDISEDKVRQILKAVGCDRKEEKCK